MGANARASSASAPFSSPSRGPRGNAIVAFSLLSEQLAPTASRLVRLSNPVPKKPLSFDELCRSGRNDVKASGPDRRGVGGWGAIGTVPF